MTRFSAMLDYGDLAGRLDAACIAWVADRRYLPLAMASAASALPWLSRPVALRLLTVDVDAGTRREAAAFFRDRGQHAEIIDLGAAMTAAGLDRLPTMRQSITAASYGRLLAPDLLREFDTVVYLDGDTLIGADLCELAAARPAALAAAGTRDMAGDSPRCYSLNGLDPPKGYFNSGVCIVNAAYWRDRGIGARCVGIATDPDLRLTMHDQDTLNLVFGAVFERIDLRWNFTKGQSWTGPDTRPFIAHFAGRIHPWDPRDRRVPQVFRDQYAALFAALPGAVTDRLDALAMPPEELRRARAWMPVLERHGLRRRSGWNPRHAAALADWRPGVIPRVIHMLWLQGWDAAPPLARHVADRWQALNPGHVLHRHEATALGPLRAVFPGDLDRLPPQTRADLFRAHTLAHEGGVWVDASVVPQRPLAEWFGAAEAEGFFAIRGPAANRVMDNWFLGADPSHPLIAGFWRAALDYWQPRPKPLLAHPLLSRDPHRRAVRSLNRLQRMALPPTPAEPRDYVRRDGPAAWHHLFPYFWFQYLFADMVATRPELGALWDAAPSLPSAGAHTAAWYLKRHPDAPLADILRAAEGGTVQKLRFKRSLSAERQLEIARALAPA